MEKMNEMKEVEQDVLKPRDVQSDVSGQGLEEIEGAVGRWDNDMGSVVYVKQNGKWVDAVQGKNCDTDGLHYEFNLQGRKVIVSIDDNANFEIGDTDGFEEVQ